MRNKRFLKKLGAGTLAALMAVSSIPVNATELNTEATTEFVTESVSEPAAAVETEASAPETTFETEAPAEDAPVETRTPEIIVPDYVETDAQESTDGFTETESPEAPGFTDDTSQTDVIFDNESESDSESVTETEENAFQVTLKEEHADVYFASDLLKLKNGTLEDPDLLLDPVPETEADTKEKAEKRAAAIKAAKEILPDEYASILTDDAYKLLMKQNHDFDGSAVVGFYIVPEEGYEVDSVKAYVENNELEIMDYENSAYEITMPEKNVVLEIKTVESSAEETETETEVETETDETRVGFLEATSDGMDMTILAPDESGFPEGSELKLYAGPELKQIYGEEDENWTYEDFLNNLKDEWKEQLNARYAETHPKQEISDAAIMEMLQSIYPFYFEVVEKDGTEVPLSDEVKVYTNFYNEEVYNTAEKEESDYAVGYHDLAELYLTPNSEVSLNTEKHCLAVDTDAKDNGLYSFVQIKQDDETSSCTCGSTAEDPLAHEWDCPVFWEAFMQDCNCGTISHKITDHDVSCEAVWAAFDASCSGCDAKGIYTLHNDCEVLARIHKELCDCGTDYTDLDEAMETHDEDSDFVLYLMKLADFVNNQFSSTASDTGSKASTAISKTSGWTDGTGHSDSDYLPMKFYSGKTTWKLLGTAASGKWVKTKTNGYEQAWQPVVANLSDRTSHGARYNNAIYDYKTGAWYDVEFVIQNYNKTTSGGTTIYPFIGFHHDRLQFDFDRAGDVVLRCNIYKAGTNTFAKIKVKVPIWDIDNAQYVGIRPADAGTVDHKYYYPGADSYLRAGNDISVCGTAFHYVEAKYATTADNLNTPAACAVWEMNTTHFYFGIGYYNNSSVSWSTRLERYNKMKSGGLAAGGYFAVVDIYSQDNVAPDLQTPMKRVSSDNSTFGTSNTLSSTTSNYYYRIDYPVLDTIPSYHFSSMVIQDTLPSGADFVDSLKVTSVQDGKDRTSWFTTSTSNDVIKLTATSSALSSNDFYGLTYRVTFKVKMDPTEISPSYNTAGKATYTVKNTASVTVKRGTAAATTKKTNEVTTTAALDRATYAAPTKGIDGNSNLKTKKIGKSDTITFSVFQKTVAANNAVAPNVMIMKDVLDNSLQYQSHKVYYLKDGAWTAYNSFKSSINGQTVTLTHDSGSFNYASTYRFDITCKIKSGYNLSSYIKTLSDGYKYYVIPNTANVTLKFPGGNDISKDTNQVTVYTSLGSGSLKVNKTLSGNTEAFFDSIPDQNKTFTYTLSGTAADGRTVNKTFKVLGGSSNTITDIPIGTYTLTESYGDLYWTCTSTNPQSTTITVDGTTEKTFDNKVALGNLTISKEISGVDESKIKDEEDKTFQFVLSGTSAYGTTVNEIRSLVGAGEVSFEDIPVGTYTLTENFDGSMWSSSNESQSVTITKDQTNKISVTNTYIFNPERTPQPAPEKSFDGKRNVSRKQITKRSDLVTFSIYQQVKASEYEESAPTGLEICDDFDPAFEVVEGKIYRSTDTGLSWESADDTFRFEEMTASGGTGTVFYTVDDDVFMDTAVWYRADITVRVKSDYSMESYLQKVNGTEMYVIPNKAYTNFFYKQGTPATVTQHTNKVDVLMPIDELSIEVKKSNEVTGENISDAKFTVYEWDGTDYSIEVGKMTYDKNRENYIIKALRKTDVNQGKFKIVETVTPWGHIGSWSKEVVVGNNATETYEATNPMGMGTITIIKKNKHEELLEGAVYSITAKENIVSPQGQVLITAGTEVEEVTTGEDGTAVSKELYPGKYTVEETKAPQGYALSKTPQDVEVLYKDKDTEVTNVEVTFVNERLYSTIEVTKEIDTDSVVWAHGNPTFTFKVTGMDLVGVEHTYYDTVEFTQDNIGSGDKSTLTVTFNVPTGIYTVSEEKTVRYAFGNIHDVVNGTIDGETAVIDVSGEKDGTAESGSVGKATFYNEKVTDEDLTDTAFVRNTIA